MISTETTDRRPKMKKKYTPEAVDVDFQKTVNKAITNVESSVVAFAAALEAVGFTSKEENGEKLSAKIGIGAGSLAGTMTILGIVMMALRESIAAGPGNPTDSGFRLIHSVCTETIGNAESICVPRGINGTPKLIQYLTNGFRDEPLPGVVHMGAPKILQ